jgi:hypothetical protein
MQALSNGFSTQKVYLAPTALVGSRQEVVQRRDGMAVVGGVADLSYPGQHRSREKLHHSISVSGGHPKKRGKSGDPYYSGTGSIHNAAGDAVLKAAIARGRRYPHKWNISVASARTVLVLPCYAAG